MHKIEERLLRSNVAAIEMHLAAEEEHSSRHTLIATVFLRWLALAWLAGLIDDILDAPGVGLVDPMPPSEVN